MAATRTCAPAISALATALCRRHPAAHHRCGRRARGRCRRRRGRAAAGRRSCMRRDDKHQPVSVKELALGLPQARLAHDRVARGHGRARCPRALRACAFVPRIATTICTDSRPEEWLLIEWPKGENEPTKYWLSTLPQDIAFRSPGRPDQAALAHRARLSGPQAGSRARAFRRARMARLPSSRHAVHRSLRIPDLRAGDDSPLRTSFHRAVPGTCRSRRLSTQRLRRCGPNATSRTRSRPCAGGSSSRSSDAAAMSMLRRSNPKTHRVEIVHDAVRLVLRLEVDRLRHRRDVGPLLEDRVGELLGPPMLMICPVASSRSPILPSAAASRKSAAIFSFSSLDIDLMPNRPTRPSHFERRITLLARGRYVRRGLDAGLGGDGDQLDAAGLPLRLHHRERRHDHLDAAFAEIDRRHLMSR